MIQVLHYLNFTDGGLGFLNGHIALFKDLDLPRLIGLQVKAFVGDSVFEFFQGLFNNVHSFYHFYVGHRYQVYIVMEAIQHGFFVPSWWWLCVIYFL